jgi:hypothetical protein
MNRIHKAVYTKEFRDEAVKLAMTEGVGVSEAAPPVDLNEDLGELGTRGEGESVQKLGRLPWRPTR